MSATTALDLLAHADLLTRELRRTAAPVTSAQWNSYDATLHRLLLEIAGLNAFHVRPGDPSRAAMHLIMRSYPQPLHAPAGTTLTIEQAAPFLGYQPSAVRDLVRHGGLPARFEDGAYRIRSDDLPAEPDIHPAAPTDPHPLARVSCALGAMADLLHESRTAGDPVMTARGEIAGATIHVLSLAAVAARHTLSHGPLDDVVRPVLIARYAERAIDALRDVTLRPASLGDLLAVSTATPPRNVTERLDTALHQWQHATRDELERMIPGVDVIRQIANQGAHLCAVTDLLNRGREPDADAAPAAGGGSLGEARQALHRGEHAWDHLSTLTRPSHEFVTASRELYESLHAVATAIQHGDRSLDHTGVAGSLRRGLTAIGDLTTATRGLPEMLLNARVLLAPATAIPPAEDRVTQRLRREHIHVDCTDIPNLVRDWTDTCATVHELTQHLDRSVMVGGKQSHPLLGMP